MWRGLRTKKNKKSNRFAMSSLGHANEISQCTFNDHFAKASHSSRYDRVRASDKAYHIVAS